MLHRPAKPGQVLIVSPINLTLPLSILSPRPQPPLYCGPYPAHQTGELERVSTSAREEARKLSQGRRGSAGTAAQAAVQQHAAHGHPVAGTAVAEEDEGSECSFACLYTVWMRYRGENEG